MNNFLNLLKKEFSFSGRLNRMAFANRYFLAIAVSKVLDMIPEPATDMFNIIIPFSNFDISVSLIFIIPAIYQLAIITKRFHDLNFSGLWSFLWVILVISIFINIILESEYMLPLIIGFFVILLLLLFVKGTTGTNKYGDDPLKKQDTATLPDKDSAQIPPNQS